MTRSILSLLTKTELEVAELVADGLTNQAIALERVTETRTTERHLGEIYSKLPIPHWENRRIYLARLIWNSKRNGALKKCIAQNQIA